MNDSTLEVHRLSSALINEWAKELKVEDIRVNFKMDTGGQVNVSPLHIYEKLS